MFTSCRYLPKTKCTPKGCGYVYLLV